MPMAEPPRAADREDARQALTREFAAGLSERAATLRDALAACAGGFAAADVETLYYKAHALKGTAASYGADELVEPAARLAGIGRGWLERRTVAVAEHAAALAALGELDAAVARYRARIGIATP
jgi:HPt (histidine-containing phosphotransfer) domain-containing protein